MPYNLFLGKTSKDSVVMRELDWNHTPQMAQRKTEPKEYWIGQSPKLGI